MVAVFGFDRERKLNTKKNKKKVILPYPNFFPPLGFRYTHPRKNLILKLVHLIFSCIETMATPTTPYASASLYVGDLSP